MKKSLLDYFEMTRMPFGKNLSRQELFMYPQIQELEEMLKITVEDRSMLLITGRAGAGKTTPVRACLGELPRQYKVIYLGQDRRGNSLFARLAQALGLRPELSRNYRSLHLSTRIENEVVAGGKELVLVVDETHMLERDALEELRLLSNSEMDSKSLISLVMLGQIWIRDRLKYREYEALNQRLRLRYALEGLCEQETGDYIRHHLALAGVTKELFTPEAIRQIFVASGGLLRPIGNICIASLLKTKSTKRKSIDGAIVKRVVQEQEVI